MVLRNQPQAAQHWRLKFDDNAIKQLVDEQKNDSWRVDCQACELLTKPLRTMCGYAALLECLHTCINVCVGVCANVAHNVIIIKGSVIILLVIMHAVASVVLVIKAKSQLSLRFRFSQ